MQLPLFIVIHTYFSCRTRPWSRLGRLHRRPCRYK